MQNNEAFSMLDSHNETFAEFLRAELSGNPDLYRAIKKDQARSNPELRTKGEIAKKGARLMTERHEAARATKVEQLKQREAELQEQIKNLTNAVHDHRQVLDAIEQKQAEERQKAEDERSRQRVFEALYDGFTRNSRNK